MTEKTDLPDEPTMNLDVNDACLQHWEQFHSLDGGWLVIGLTLFNGTKMHFSIPAGDLPKIRDNVDRAIKALAYSRSGTAERGGRA